LPLEWTRSVDLLLGEVVFVLLFDAQLGKLFQLLPLNTLDLESIFLELLAYLAALLEVVQPVLLLEFLVLRDLRPNLNY
jgi:hypothetical protein